jgi:long-chain acyl-CoA synthetase
MKSQQTVNTYRMIRYMLESLSQRIAPHKRVHSFEIRREPLPRTTTRKIKRFQVQQELEEKPSTPTSPQGADTVQPRTATEEKVFRIIKEMKTHTDIHPQSNLELDLGFDSLQRVELLSTIQETFQVQISDDSAAQIFTVEELVEAVESRLGRETSEREVLTEFAFYLTAKTVYILSLLLFRLKVKGRKNLPHEYPYLICPNHLSFLDAFVLVSPFPYRIIKRIFFLGYADYFNRPLLSFLGRLIRVVPVDADRHLRQALRLGAEGLRRGYILCVFPEGEGTCDSGQGNGSPCGANGY